MIPFGSPGIPAALISGHNSVKLLHLERYRPSSACITIRLLEGIGPSSNDSSLALPARTFLESGFLRPLDDVVVAVSCLRHDPSFDRDLGSPQLFLCILIREHPSIFFAASCYRRFLVTSLLLMTMGGGVCSAAGLFYSFPLCLAGIFLVALGGAAWQTVANPGISLFCPANTVMARLLLMQGFNSLRSMIGLIAGVCYLAHGAGTNRQ